MINKKEGTMSDTKNTGPLDLSRYEGHTATNFWFKRGVTCLAAAARAAHWDEEIRWDTQQANERLIADAPLLLAEAKRLRDALSDCVNLLGASEGGDYDSHLMLSKTITNARRVLGEEGGDV